MKFYLLYKYIEKEGFPYIKYEKLISTRHNILPENFPEYKIAIVDINCNSFLVKFYGDESAEYGIDTLCSIAEPAISCSRTDPSHFLTFSQQTLPQAGTPSLAWGTFLSPDAHRLQKSNKKVCFFMFFVI